jgi:hypothetical protein
MRDTFNILDRLQGQVIVTCDGVSVLGHNDVVYTGGDVLARLLAGHSAYRISHICFEFENTVGTPAAAAVQRSDTIATLHGLATPRDFVRAPLVSEPSIVAADASHQGNQVTFHALTAASTGVLHAQGFSVASNSKVFAVSLIAAPGGSNYLQDVLYARYRLTTPLPVGPTGQASATWVTKAV